MAVGVAIHVEDGNRVGIWPSYLDELRNLGLACGVDKWAIIDCTLDGWFGGMGDNTTPCERYTTVEDWFADVQNGDTIIGMETQNVIEANGQTATAMVDYIHPDDNVWYVIGPSNGLPNTFIDGDKDWVYIDYGGVGVHGLFIAVDVLTARRNAI